MPLDTGLTTCAKATKLNCRKSVIMEDVPAPMRRYANGQPATGSVSNTCVNAELAYGHIVPNTNEAMYVRICGGFPQAS